MGEMACDGVDGRHKLAAAGLDARLKADAMQTVCHGDPKDMNMLFAEDGAIAFVDFQWTGKAPPAKDVAYCLACAASGCSPSEEQELLSYYHGELTSSLVEQGDQPPSLEYFQTSYHVAMCDLARWMAGWGWWGNVRLLKGHAELLLGKLGLDPEEAAEAECERRLFSLYPP
mmetsp:Transcript_19299/g.54318  ORF Transcript_19299/g.54318 Transcript_19299/m.54318 type:complete len:172 (+) Transcript_19299:2-517(+)